MREDAVKTKKLNCAGGERCWEVWVDHCLVGYVARRPTDRLYRVFEYSSGGARLIGVGPRLKTTAALLDRMV